MILFPPHWIAVVIPLGKLLLYQEMKGVKKKRREGAGQRKKERKNDTAKESREQWRIGGRKKSESLLER